MPINVELHFQEGFSGEAVDISVNGKPASHLVAKTRVQTGLAQIERLSLANGDTVRITIPATGAETSIKASTAQPYVAVNLTDGQINIQARKDSPGYM